MLAYAAWGQFRLSFTSNVPGTTNRWELAQHVLCLSSPVLPRDTVLYGGGDFDFVVSKIHVTIQDLHGSLSSPNRLNLAIIWT